VADGFLMGGLHESLLPRLCMIGNGPLRVLPAGKVNRQHRGNLRRTMAIPRLQPHPNAPMSLHPPRLRQPSVEHLLIQDMSKPIPPTHRPIRPCRQPTRLQERPPLGEHLTALLDQVECGLQACRHTRHRKLDHGYAGHVQQAPLIGAQLP
jgi:hypothetical protein